MHHASFMRALQLRFGEKPSLPRAPLIVDLGCGPATAYLALCDWMEDTGTAFKAAAYIGIDSSTELLRVGRKLIEARAEIIGSDPHLWLRETLTSLEGHEIEDAVANRDGVIFALSYILHQESLQDMRTLASLMRRVHHAAHGLPAWFLLQDANFAEHPNAITAIWPESRVNTLADHCADFGYTLPVQKTTFNARHVMVSDSGTFIMSPAGNTDNVCMFFHKLTDVDSGEHLFYTASEDP